MLKGYQVTKATAQEADDLLQLVREVAHWLEERGENQWNTVRSGEEDAEILEAIKSGETYIVRKENKLAAMFILYHEQTHWDEWLWGKLNDSSVYLHKFAITPVQIGEGLGSALIQWMENNLFERNIELFKLDCLASNENLNEFYTACGFKKTRTSKGFSLFEKRIYKSQTEIRDK